MCKWTSLVSSLYYILITSIRVVDENHKNSTHPVYLVSETFDVLVNSMELETEPCCHLVWVWVLIYIQYDWYLILQFPILLVSNPISLISSTSNSNGNEFFMWIFQYRFQLDLYPILFSPKPCVQSVNLWLLCVHVDITHEFSLLYTDHFNSGGWESYKFDRSCLFGIRNIYVLIHSIGLDTKRCVAI